MISRPTVGTSQITATTISTMCTGDREMNSTIRADSVAGWADELGGVDGHPWIACLRNRLMLKAMIGMIRSSITTAIAERSRLAALEGLVVHQSR